MLSEYESKFKPDNVLSPPKTITSIAEEKKQDTPGQFNPYSDEEEEKKEEMYPMLDSSPSPSASEFDMLQSISQMNAKRIKVRIKLQRISHFSQDILHIHDF